MDGYQVRFTCTADPEKAGGIVMGYERVEDITHTPSSLTVKYGSMIDMDAAFLAAGIYLHSFGQADPERDVRPKPDQDFIVTDDLMRTLGFAIPR